MRFTRALDLLIDGKATYIRLPHWSTEVKILLQLPSPNTKMNAPYLYVDSRKGRVPWRETFPELFAHDWEAYRDTIDEFGNPQYTFARVDESGEFIHGIFDAPHDDIPQTPELTE